LDLDESGGPETNGGGSGPPVSSEFTALSEAGMWEYSELAERVFTRGSASPDESDAEEFEEHDESSDAMTDDSEPECLSPKGDARARHGNPAGGTAGPVAEGSQCGPRPPPIRPRRSRAEVRYAEDSGDDGAAASDGGASLEVAPDPEASATAGQAGQAAPKRGAKSTSSGAKAPAARAQGAAAAAATAAAAAKGSARRASSRGKPRPAPPAGFAVDPPPPPGDLGAALVGRALLYWWPEDGWQRGAVARACARAGPFSHVVAYSRRTSALGGTAESLLDAASYGDRWVLLSPAAGRPAGRPQA
jgi:hypothetical protein